MGRFLDPVQIGHYSAVARFVLPLSIVLVALHTALWPRVAVLADTGALVAMLKKMVIICAMLALAGGVYAVVAPLVAPRVFGADYGESVFFGQLLCLRSCLAILVFPVGIVGYSFGLVRVYWIVNLLQLALVAAINVAFLADRGPLPRWWP